jgi:hypothetical protein
MLKLSMAPKSFPPPKVSNRFQPIAVTGAPWQVPLLSPQNASPEASIDPSSTTENVCVEN